MIKFSKNI